MKAQWRLLDLPPMTAAENMALDEVLVEVRGSGHSRDTLRFLQFRPATVLVGFHQSLQEEVRLSYCREHGIDVNRRITGGGGLLDVYVAAGLLIVANLALGLLISTRARSQFQAMQMTMFVFLPSILLSGFLFPFAGMPKVAQWLAEVLPLTHFIRLIRGVMLRGAGLAQQWTEVAALAGFTFVMMAVAIRRFRKRLD